MTDKPNCSTCPHWVNRFQGQLDICPLRRFQSISSYEDHIHYITREVGCLSHPGAREWLMKDVIKELERRTKLFGGHYGVAYQSAIFLIRDGVKA